ncbi:MAG TPA: ATP-binding protein [Ktedonobacteraceae bacterium]
MLEEIGKGFDVQKEADNEVPLCIAKPDDKTSPGTQPASSDSADRIADLEKELSAIRARMQEMLEERDAAKKEWQTINEEIRLTNEEWQSINEKLLSSKEKLLVINEEMNIANQELQVANEDLHLLTDLIELAHDAIVVRDPESRVISWNQGAEELYGWTAREAMSRVTHSLLQTRFPQTSEEVERALEQEGQWEGELIYTRRDGTQLTVASRQVMVRGRSGRQKAILEVNRDITEQRRLQQVEQHARAEMAAQLTVLQRILDELPGGVYLVRGQDARLVLANRAVVDVWGATWLPGQIMEEFLTTNGIRIFGVDGHPLALEDLATLKAVRYGEMVRHQQEVIRHPDGTILPVLVNAVALDAADLNDLSSNASTQTAERGDRAALVVHQDVSALKEAELFKNEFLSIAAHELRTPLAVLKGFVQTLIVQTQRGKGPQLAEWQQEALQDIDHAVNRLDRLTDELLDVSRLQAGHFVLHREPMDLVNAARRVIAQRQLTTDRHVFSLKTEMEHVPIYADQGRIEQVLSNLLSNAIKYSPNGGPIEVSIRKADTTKDILLSVLDYGIGIPAQQQARIFGRFERAENAHDFGIEGTGLGLFLCRELIEWHRGRIWFTSVEGRGSNFFISLPLAPDVVEESSSLSSHV